MNAIRRWLLALASYIGGALEHEGIWDDEVES